MQREKKRGETHRFSKVFCLKKTIFGFNTSVIVFDPEMNLDLLMRPQGHIFMSAVDVVDADFCHF